MGELPEKFSWEIFATKISLKMRLQLLSVFFFTIRLEYPLVITLGNNFNVLLEAYLPVPTEID